MLLSFNRRLTFFYRSQADAGAINGAVADHPPADKGKGKVVEDVPMEDDEDDDEDDEEYEEAEDEDEEMAEVGLYDLHALTACLTRHFRLHI